MKLCEKSCFQLSVGVPIYIERFEYFVQPFKEESPESVHWAVSAHKFSGVRRVMIVRLDGTLAIKLVN